MSNKCYVKTLAYFLLLLLIFALFRIHYPKKDSGNMRVVQKPKLGNYPVALIPGKITFM